MNVNPYARGQHGCLCCGETNLASEQTVISPYLSYKALRSRPEPSEIHHCQRCDFRFYHRGLTDEEGNAYYRGYRDETYFTDRHRFEPFYTRAVHDGLTERLGSESRQDAFYRALPPGSLGKGFDCVIDYGGGDGVLISKLPAKRRISFDLSGTPGRAGVEVIQAREALPEGVDLVTCAQVLEHVSDPSALLDDMISLLRPAGLVYLEVPDQLWGRISRARPSRRFIEWLCRHPRLLLAADIYSTAFRVKLGVLPPFGFVPMREHINFFSKDGLRSFAERGNLRLIAEGRAEDDSFYLLAEKLA